MSTEETNVPKRRSSNARRRARSQRATATTPQVADTSVDAAEPTTSVETVDRNQRRRDERKAAKAQSEKKGMARVVDGERFSGARGFYNDTTSEIRKVIWPDRQQTVNLTLLVIALSVIMGSLLGGIDWVLLQLFERVA